MLNNDRFGCPVYVVSSLYCGARHNADLNLSGTENKYANRLRAIGAAHSFFRLYSLHQREYQRLQDSHYAHLLP